MERTRTVEFAASGSDPDELIAAIRRVSGEIGAAFAAPAPAALDRRVRPPREPWGTGVPRESSGRDALAESIRHAALPLGELRLTRDLAVHHA